MKTSFNKLRCNNRGATAIEYGLLAALISIVLILGINFLGTQLNSTFSKVGSTLSTTNAL